MKRLLLLLFLLSIAAEGLAQDVPLFLSGQRQPVRISLGAAYQDYSEDGGNLSEFSMPLSISFPLGRRFGVSMMASQMSASGDEMESVSGFSDTQVGLSYYQPVGEGSVVASLGLNVPSGQDELTRDEFETSILLSQQFYNFRVPALGQGFNVAPGLVAAFRVSEHVVVGVGASYQFKGAYKPQENMLADYNPGDELTLTGGLDVRVGAVSNLSLDVSFTRYGSDTVDDEDIYQAGNTFSATAQWLHYLGRNELRFVAYGRSPSKGTVPAALAGGEAELQTLPALLAVRSVYRPQVTSGIILGLIAQARFFGETDLSVTLDSDINLFDSRTLFDVGVAPEVPLSEQVSLHGHFLYTLGDLTGFEAGGRLVLAL